MDAMDKLGTFIDTINKAMPGAWDAVIRQAYIHGIIFIVGGVISAAIAVLAGAYIASESKKSEESNRSSDLSFEMGAGIAFALLAIVCIITGIVYLTNPEYQAIQMLKP